MPGKLTEREKDLVLELQRLEDLDPHGGASYEELRQALGLRSRSNIARMVESLEEKKWIVRSTNRKRSLQLVCRIARTEICPEVGSGPDPGPYLKQLNTEILIAELAERGIVVLGMAADDEIVAEVERRGLRVSPVSA